MKEKLAERAHQQWAAWMKYMFKQGTFNSDGSWTMNKWTLSRWQHQMTTPYAELSESEKDSDRHEAVLYLEIMNKCNRQTLEKI